MISIGDVIALIDKGKNFRDYYSKLKEKQVDKFINSEKGGRQRLPLYEFLADLYYDMDILNGPDGPFPVGVYDIVDAALEYPDRLLGELSLHQPKITVSHYEIVDALKRRGVNMWNDRTFSLDSVLLDAYGKVDKVNACLGRYFDMVSSADYLELEILAAIENFRAPIVLDHLPARGKALSQHATPGQCLQFGGGVDSAMAISTLVVYLREGRYWLLCDVRSKKVAVHSDLYHVMPSFMFQPVVGQVEPAIRTEWSIVHGIYREYLEELFSVAEVEDAGGLAPDYFYGHKNLVFLQQLIKDGLAQIRGIAFAFNLLNHRPEICSLLLITDESWYEFQKDKFEAQELGLCHLNLSESEFLKIKTGDYQIHPEILTTMPIEEERWAQYVRPWLMVPPGAAALILGAKAAVSILGIQEPEWLQKMGVRKAGLGSP